MLETRRPLQPHAPYISTIDAEGAVAFPDRIPADVKRQVTVGVLPQYQSVPAKPCSEGISHVIEERDPWSAICTNPRHHKVSVEALFPNLQQLLPIGTTEEDRALHH